MGNQSKIIRKTDDSAMALLYEILGEDMKNVLDIDSYYNIEGVYHFLEFIKCDCNPFDYNIDENLNNLFKPLSIIWDFCKRADGIFWIICYNKDKTQFKLLKVNNLNEENVELSEEYKLSFAQFKNWFQKMNNDVLKNK
jgi:hypothetical protein